MTFRKIITVQLIICMSLVFVACGNKESSKNLERNTPNTLEISFPYVRQSGSSNNQFAVWIESDSGEYIKTLSVTKYTATKGYKVQENAIPTWVKKSNISKKKTKEIDAVTEATPKSGDMVYIWDLKDKDGAEIPKGSYKFVVEGTTSLTSRITYSGKIEIGGEEATVKAEPQYVGNEAKESDMIGEVVAKYNP